MDEEKKKKMNKKCAIKITKTFCPHRCGVPLLRLTVYYAFTKKTDTLKQYNP